MSKKANSTMRRRILFAGVMFGVVAFGCVGVRLFAMQVINNDYYEEKAIAQQTRDKTIPATRGTIYDTNMKPLAISATVEMVTLEAKKIKDEAEAEFIAKNLSEILGMDYETVLAKTMKKKSAYEVLIKGVEKEQADAVREFKKENKLTSIYLMPDTKRYYPFGNFASHVLGFVGSDNQGLDGVEAQYDSYLTGVPGRIITATNAKGEEMPFSYEMYYEAENGANVVLTIDEVIQHYLEKNLEIAAFDNKVANRTTGIIMDVNTGAILAMATKGDFDPNNPFEIADATEAARIATLPEEEQKDAKALARQEQWRNKAVSDTFDPGSTFKIITAALAIEEKTVTTNNTFYCPGYRMVEGWNKKINCWKTVGHGSETFYQAIQNSCNPAFMDIGLSVGAPSFLKYIRAFGLTEKTNIDLPGEAVGIFHSEKKFLSNKVDLAVASFGQNFSVSPIQLITAVSAVANGGNLMQPYVVKEISRDDGSIVKSTEPKVVRQVVSEETSILMRDVIESVVTVGTGKNAYVAGYRIAGKTGTSEKIAKQIQTGRSDLRIASFMAFAPADDPQIAVLVLLDEPTVPVKTGGITVGPVIRRIMADVLPYLGVEPAYTQSELVAKDVTVPSVIGLSKVEAQSAMEKAGVSYRTTGSAETVTDQMPIAGAKIPSTANAVIYLGGEKPKDLVTVPDISGLSESSARARLESAGLYMKITGVSSGNIVASKQSHAPGTQVAMGTVVTAEFVDLDQRAE